MLYYFNTATRYVISHYFTPKGQSQRHVVKISKKINRDSEVSIKTAHTVSNGMATSTESDQSTQHQMH